jgi:hypothetical protein
MPLTGRRPVTPEELSARVAAYCARYDVRPNDVGLPPFPTGRRETDQHREWLALYKAHDRVQRRTASASGMTCPVCLAASGSHADCRALLKLARSLGPDAVDRARRHLWPDPPI